MATRIAGISPRKPIMTNMPDDQMGPAIDAVAAACRVARFIQQDLARVRQITKDDRSPVTVADYAVQAIVAMALRDSMHDALIVGEEHAGILRKPEHEAVRRAVVDAVRMVHGDATEDIVIDAIDACDHDGTAERFWTLDPIDGTKGFLRGSSMQSRWRESRVVGSCSAPWGARTCRATTGAPSMIPTRSA